MKLERSTYQKPLSLTGLGGGATSLGLGGAGVGSHFYFTYETGGNYPEIQDIKVDSSANLYVSGKRDSAGATLFKFDSKGALQWGKKRDFSGLSFYGVEVDSSGNIYVAGYNSYQGGQMCVLKYNSSGVVQWQRMLGNGTTSQDHRNYCLTMDTSDNVYLGGYEDSSGSDRMFLAKWNSSGSLQWQKTFQTGTYLDVIHSMEWASGNRLYVTGMTYQPAPYSSSNMYLGRFSSSNGSHSWSRIIRGSSGGAGMTYRNFDVAPYSNGGYVYCAGQIVNSQTGNESIILSSFNNGGTEQWSRVIWTSGGTTYVHGVDSDSSGNAYVLGRDYNQKMIILKYNSSGVLQWQRNFTSAYNEYANGPTIKVDNLGSFYIGIQTRAPVDGANTPRHLLVAKLPDDGSLTGTYGDFTYSASSYTDSPRSDFTTTITSSLNSTTLATSSFLERDFSTTGGTETSETITLSELTYFD